jgi:molybdate transport system regulatory protein
MNMTNGYQLLSKLYLNHNGETFITPERIELLRSVIEQGSISAGAKGVGKSYKWAWDSVEQMNQNSNTLLVSKSSGGKGGGGARITAFAQELIAYYDDLERINQSKIARYQESFQNAFEAGHFTNDIASTLHGRVEEIVYHGDICEVSIAYGATVLKAKCKRHLGLKEGIDIAFMVESNQIIIAKEPVAISARNLLKGVISEINQEDKNVYLSLRLESDEVLKVLITNESLKQFELGVGVACFAYFKTYNITILGERT